MQNFIWHVFQPWQLRDCCYKISCYFMKFTHAFAFQHVLIVHIIRCIERIFYFVNTAVCYAHHGNSSRSFPNFAVLEIVEFKVTDTLTKEIHSSRGTPHKDDTVVQYYIVVQQRLTQKRYLYFFLMRIRMSQPRVEKNVSYIKFRCKWFIKAVRKHRKTENFFLSENNIPYSYNKNHI